MLFTPYSVLSIVHCTRLTLSSHTHTHTHLEQGVINCTCKSRTGFASLTKPRPVLETKQDPERGRREEHRALE